MMMHQTNSKTECAPECKLILGLFVLFLDSNNLDFWDENQGFSTVFRTRTTFTVACFNPL